MNATGPKAWRSLALVFLLLAGSLVVLAGTTQAQGKRIWGYVTECGATQEEFPATASLVNALTGSDAATASVDEVGRDYSFASPSPGYYFLRAAADGYFTEESAIFRFDGTASVRKDLCLDPHPAPPVYYNLTAVDAAAGSASKTLTFTELADSDVVGKTNEYDPGTMTATLDKAPLVWGSESVLLYNKTTKVEYPLTLGADYEYGASNWAYPLASKLLVTNASLHENLTYGNTQLNVSYEYVGSAEFSLAALLESATATVNGTAFGEGDNWTVDLDGGDGEVLGNFTFGRDALVFNYTYVTPIGSASVEAWEVDHDEEVGSGTTGPNGQLNLALFAGTFTLLVTKDQYAAYTDTILLGANTSARVYLAKALKLTVGVTNGDGEPLTEGVSGILFNLDTSLPLAARIVPGTVSANSNTIVFRLAEGNYTMILDANGYVAHVGDHPLNATTIASTVWSFALDAYWESEPALEERVDTRIAYNASDWNRITVWRNAWYLEDSVVPGLEHPELRNAALQIDVTLGNADGTLNATEAQAFEDWVQSAGPKWVVTDGRFSTNGITHLSEAGTFSSSVTWVGSAFYVNTSANYTYRGTTAVTNDLAAYDLGLDVSRDANASVYVNASYVIELPPGYERTSKHSSEVSGFTTVTVDPTTASSTRFDLEVARSTTGKARARVEGPSGRFTETNTTDAGYAAVVAGDRDIFFTANATTIAQGDVQDANYSWAWGDGAPDGYGVWTTHNFTTGGTYTVNLTVTEPNPANVTYFNLRITVDITAPTADFDASKTPVNESETVRFTSGDSSDGSGQIVEYTWNFGDNTTGVGQNVTHAFEEPGNYTVTLRVKDWVGHESADKTLTIQVKDVTDPSIGDLAILRTSNWAQTPASQVSEGVEYAFNATAAVSDNFCSDDQMTFTWTFKDTSTNVTKTGQNVTYRWTTPGSYEVNLTVTDCQGNVAYRVFPQVVAVDESKHANLKLEGPPKAEPASVEEGGTTTITVKVKNYKGARWARDISLTAELIVSGQGQAIAASVSWTTEAGVATNSSIAPGGIKVAKFTYNLGSELTTKTIEVKVSSGDEPDPWNIPSENRGRVSVSVKAAGWKGYIIPLIFLVFIIGVPVIVYVYRKITSGEWELGRGRGGEEEEEEEAEEEEEEAPKKKRL